MLKSTILVLILAFVVIASSSIAMADDASDIQALVTADMTAHDFGQPGVFYEFDVTTRLPFAYARLLIGTLGYGGMTYALSKSSGTWKILGSGGGYMVPSILVDYGMPIPTAEALQGASCHVQPRMPHSKTRGPALTFFSTSAALKQRVARYGPSVLPRRTVFTRYNGRVQAITIVKPLHGRACLGV